MYDKAELRENLRKCVAHVKFEKADGSIRDMHCTLMEQYLPPKKKEASPRKENDSTIAVWDLDKAAWRSFHLDSVIDIQYIGVDRV